jgi:nucleoside 2-deoxyribosyltransferase
MKEFRYEQSENEVRNFDGPSVFLAGPTVRGNQPHLTSWRFAAIDEFKKQGFDGALIIPEFTSKTESDKGKDWIPLWEFNGLKRADCIMFWIPRTRELIGLTTNWEFGYWIGRDIGKVVYGRPDDAYRIGYLDIMWKAIIKEINGGREVFATIHNSLESTVLGSISFAKIWRKLKNETTKYSKNYFPKII